MLPTVSTNNAASITNPATTTRSTHTPKRRRASVVVCILLALTAFAFAFVLLSYESIMDSTTVHTMMGKVKNDGVVLSEVRGFDIRTNSTHSKSTSNASTTEMMDDTEPLPTKKSTARVNVAQYTKCADLPPFPAYLQELQRTQSSNMGINIPALIHNMSLRAPTTSETETYVRLLAPYITCMPPAVVIRDNPFQYRTDAQIAQLCAAEPRYFSGARAKDKRAYIIDSFAYAYESGIFELRLKESYDVVDDYLVWESIYGQRLIKKPLFFGANWIKRYRALDPDTKIHRFIQDDAQGDFFARHKGLHSALVTGKDWTNEGLFRTQAWTQYLQTFGGKLEAVWPAVDDIFLFLSDLDEIPTYKTMALLKYCQPIDAALHFPIALGTAGTLFERSNFDNVLPGYSTARVFKARDFLSPQKTKTANKKGYSYADTFQVVHISRGFSPFQDLAKELLMAEGGQIPPNIKLADPKIPYAGQPQLIARYNFTDPASHSPATPAAIARAKQQFTAKLLTDPNMGSYWMRSGFRLCCGKDKNQRPRNANDPILWFAFCNKHRFPFLFPSYCTATEVDEFPLKYTCKDDDVMDVNLRCQYNINGLFN